MLILDSVKKNSEPLTWPVRRSEEQPGPWCLACSWNLCILILKERSILCEEGTHRLIIETAKKFSCSACEKSQRRRLHPVTARVLREPTIMVDTGSRAASVTLQRVMDTEHGLAM